MTIMYKPASQCLSSATATGCVSRYCMALLCLLLFFSGRIESQADLRRLTRDLRINMQSGRHPRIMATPSTFATIKQRLKDGDPLLTSWFERLELKADSYLQEPVVTYEAPGFSGRTRTVLSYARHKRARIETLAMLYRLTGESKYADKAWDIMEEAASWPEWKPNHFLGTAEMTAAFAVGYDWLHDYWQEAQREILREAIITKGLKPGLEGYRESAWNWANRNNNWNPVCHGGLAMGALAVGDIDKELSEEIIRTGLTRLRSALRRFAPDGGYPEGVGYWHYAIRFLVPYSASLRTALGTDYGIMDAAGLERTGYFLPYLTGPTNLIWNFNDAGRRFIQAPELFYLANLYQEPELAGVRIMNLTEPDSAVQAKDILWYNPDNIASPAKLPLDAYFRDIEVVTMRGGWDKDALWVGLKGQKPCERFDLDTGHFMLDALGVRWAEDLGTEGAAGYDVANDGTRWSYYRKRAEGHNTLVINPGPSADQTAQTSVAITEFKSNPNWAYAIVDMTDAYADHVEYAKRGITIFDNRSKLIVQDELKLKDRRRRQPDHSELWWFMHTGTEINLERQNRTAILKEGDKRLWVRILSPADAEFTVLDARPLPTSPEPQGQYGNRSNSGIRKIAINLQGISNRDIVIAVLFVPLKEGEQAPSRRPNMIPLADWNRQ